jgi:hypothetical protein
MEAIHNFQGKIIFVIVQSVKNVNYNLYRNQPETSRRTPNQSVPNFCSLSVYSKTV